MRTALLVGALFAGLLVGSMHANSQVKPAVPDDQPFDDAVFVMKTASGGMHEVELGKLAVKTARRDDVKAFGAKMVADHTKANAELMKLAKANQWAIPAKMNEKDQKEYDHFKDLKADEFDREYVMHMVKDHEMDVAKFTKATQDAKSPELRNFAIKTLPTLQEHLKMIQEISGKLK